MALSKPPDVVFSIVIVSYRNEETITGCLNSIRDNVKEGFEIIIVDNSPDNLTCEKIRAFQKNNPETGVSLIEPGENLGFAKGCNLGASQACGEFLMFLNPDTKLINNAAGLMADFLKDNPAALVAGPKIMDSDGEITKTCRNFPSCARILLDATGLDRFAGAYRLLKFSHDVPMKVDQVIGACLCISKKTFTELNGFDERFFIYFEEVDFCKRVMDAGGEIWFRPEAEIMHAAGVSTESISNISRMITTLRRSRLLYFEKHFSRRHQLLLMLINKFEGLYRGLIFSFMYCVFRNPAYREKARGYLRVISS